MKDAFFFPLDLGKRGCHGSLRERLCEGKVLTSFVADSLSAFDLVTIQYDLTGQKRAFLRGHAPEMDASEALAFLLESAGEEAKGIFAVTKREVKRRTACAGTYEESAEYKDNTLRLPLCESFDKDAPTLLKRGHPDVQQALIAGVFGGVVTDESCER